MLFWSEFDSLSYKSFRRIIGLEQACKARSPDN